MRPIIGLSFLLVLHAACGSYIFNKTVLTPALHFGGAGNASLVVEFVKIPNPCEPYTLDAAAAYAVLGDSGCDQVGCMGGSYVI